MESQKTIYDYTNYREYIKEAFSVLKRDKPQFSFRYFNRKAGISSSAFVKLVMDGKRNLAEDGIRKIATGLSLGAEERKYFKSLVYFNQATTHEDKNYYFQEIVHHKQFARSKPLTEAQYNLFSHWYNVVILELVRLHSPEKKNVNWIASHIRPGVPLPLLRKAVKELEVLGLLVEDGRGNLSNHEGMLSTPDEVASIAVTNFHVQMSRLAMEAVTRDANADRAYASLTVAMSSDAFELAKQELLKFRKKLHSLLEQDNRKSRTVVGQINIQLFKLSR